MGEIKRKEKLKIHTYYFGFWTVQTQGFLHNYINWPAVPLWIAGHERPLLQQLLHLFGFSLVLRNPPQATAEVAPQLDRELMHALQYPNWEHEEKMACVVTNGQRKSLAYGRVRIMIIRICDLYVPYLTWLFFRWRWRGWRVIEDSLSSTWSCSVRCKSWTFRSERSFAPQSRLSRIDIRLRSRHFTKSFFISQEVLFKKKSRHTHTTRFKLDLHWQPSNFLVIFFWPKC